MGEVIKITDHRFPVSEIFPGDRLRDGPNCPFYTVIGPSRALGDRFIHCTRGNVWGIDMTDLFIQKDTIVKRIGLREYELVG